MPMKFLRLHEVEDRTGLSAPTIWRREKKGEFPRRRQLGPQIVAWLEDEIDQWIESRPLGPIPVNTLSGSIRPRRPGRKIAAGNTS